MSVLEFFRSPEAEKKVTPAPFSDEVVIHIGSSPFSTTFDALTAATEIAARSRLDNIYGTAYLIESIRAMPGDQAKALPEASEETAQLLNDAIKGALPQFHYVGKLAKRASIGDFLGSAAGPGTLHDQRALLEQLKQLDQIKPRLEAETPRGALLHSSLVPIAGFWTGEMDGDDPTQGFSWENGVLGVEPGSGAAFAVDILCAAGWSFTLKEIEESLEYIMYYVLGEPHSHYAI